MRVLVIEDDPITRTTLRADLEEWGYEPVAAENGENAWNLLDAPDPPRLVIADWMLPGMSGIEVCRRIRQKKDGGPFYVIMLTGRITTENMVTAFEAGADDYIVKPFSGRELRARLLAGVRILALLSKASDENLDAEESSFTLDLGLPPDRRVLVAEDDAISRTVLIENFAEWGYKAVPVANGDKAIEILEGDDPPNIAVLDWMMPKTDGVEVCRTVRCHKRTPPPYLIMLTAKGDTREVVAAFDAGADDYLRKPFSGPELRARINVGFKMIRLQTLLTERAERAEAGYREIFENVTEGIFRLAPHGRLLLVNPAMARFFGFASPRQLIASDFLITKKLFTDPDRFEEFRQVLEKKGRVNEFELEIFKKDGSKTWISINARARRDEAGELESYEGTVTDITKRKWAEKKLAKYNLDLEKMVDQRTAALKNAVMELETAKKAAEAANTAKSEFLSNMSHELRTPLNAIIGFSEVLQDEYFGTLNKKQAEYLKDILESGNHLLSLINDILDLSKVEVGKMELRLSAVNIKDLLENSLVMIREKAMKHGINIELFFDGDVPDIDIHADERKLKQVMFNLLSNAVKFSNDNGMIRISAEKKKNALRITVSDTGIGLAKEETEKIFEEFHQAAGGLTGKTPGTGLGLSLTRKLLQLHGAEISAETGGPGKGSRFIVTLPLKQKRGPGSAQPVPVMESDILLLNHLRRFISLAKRNKKPFTLLRIHGKGSRGELAIAKNHIILKILENDKRGYDFMRTYKNGDIDLIFPETGPEDAKAVFNRLAGKIESALSGKRISFSWAVFPDHGETAEILIGRVTEQAGGAL
ncbi:MAG: response regulator [Deltaproteobacteria bacterium]|nr:response regulator [Deltaproteobacteria bacterium]